MGLERFIRTMDRMVNSLSRLLNFGGAGFLFILMLLVMAHVIGRYILVLPIPGSVELIEFLMVLVVFFGFAECAVQRGNVSVDLFVDRLPGKAQAVIDALTCLLSIGIVSLITWQSAIQVKSLWQSGLVSGVLHIPHWPFAIVMVLGWAAFTLVLITHFFENLGRVLRK
ncbi:MAG: TRAP transporter small permease [Syntrophorhabdaceae bacterium]|nr:TRAP transporter small permease [Syntrophorhabdaceae bacterium]MDD5244604.1 TRAP transporter small permease [Syntrophorhabdaceae bacterium]